MHAGGVRGVPPAACRAAARSTQAVRPGRALPGGESRGADVPSRGDTMRCAAPSVQSDAISAAARPFMPDCRTRFDRK